MSKTTGDIGELEFIIKAKKLGFIALSPYSSICPYDVAIDNGRSVLKIQVKTVNSLATKRGSRSVDTYKVTLAKGSGVKTRYKKSEVDYFAVYVMPIGKFYIIPFKAIKTKSPNFYPEKKDHKFSKYLENWDLLK